MQVHNLNESLQHNIPNITKYLNENAYSPNSVYKVLLWFPWQQFLNNSPKIEKNTQH